jgi:two-component system chemotaxis response regulator CheY
VMTTGPDAVALKNLVVLLADGKSYSRALMRSMLSQLDLKAVHEAADGAAAIDIICAVNPGVMIVDWELPVLSVSELLRMIRTSSAIPNPNIPIIIISSTGIAAHVHAAMELGAQQFMVRPISPKMIEQRLRSVAHASRKAARYQNVPPPPLSAEPEILDDQWQIIDGR